MTDAYDVNMEDESIQFTQPLTQPLDDDGNYDSQSQSQSQREFLYWGRLYPMSGGLKACGRLCLCFETMLKSTKF